jgi:hypothetical protein
VRAGLDLIEPGRKTRIEFDSADGVGSAGVLRAVLASRPRRADAADEIKPGVELRGEVDCDLARADGEGIGLG